MNTKSRAARWMEAAEKAERSLQELVDVQSEYSDWFENLPEGLQQAPAGEKLQAIVDLDLESAHDAVEEALGVDLPRGFGRD